MGYVIGCDIGTTNVKAVAFSEKGNLLASHSTGYGMYHPEPDRSEQNPDEIAEAVFATIRHLLVSSKSFGEVLGISLSSAMHSTLAVDQKGRPITPLLIWADNRSSSTAKELRKSDLGKRTYQQNGTPIHAMAPVCKLRWLKEHQPQLFTNDHKFVGIKEYVIARLCRKFLIDYSIASATGLFDIRNLRWNPETLDYVGIAAHQLSVPVSPYHQEKLLPTNPLHLPAGTPLIMGASDGCLANLGCGAIFPETMAVTIGTSAAARICTNTPYTDDQMRTFCYLLDEETYVVGGATNSGGAVFDWMKNTLYPDVTYPRVFEEITTIAPGADGLFFLPYLLGERAPLWSSTVRGAFLGLAIQHTRAHMARAVVEGILLNLFTLIKTVRATHPVTTCYANGGFAQNRIAMQLLSTIFRIKVDLSDTVETSARGAALMGLKSLGIIPSLTEAASAHNIATSLVPDPATHQHYTRISDNFEQLVFSITQDQ
jgi:gluconokinase